MTIEQLIENAEIDYELLSNYGDVAGLDIEPKEENEDV
jgi:hypothetical protein